MKIVLVNSLAVVGVSRLEVASAARVVRPFEYCETHIDRSLLISLSKLGAQV